MVSSHSVGPSSQGDSQAREVGGSRGVEHDLGLRMVLQETGGDGGVDFAFNGSLDNGCFMLAKGQHKNFASFENRTDAHCDGTSGHVFLAEEIASGVNSRDAIERNQSGTAGYGGAGFVESDMPRAADAQELNIDAAYLLDFVFVPFAVISHLFDRQSAVGYIGLLGGDVDQIEQVLAHEADVALQLVRLHGEVLVQVERKDVRK